MSKPKYNIPVHVTDSEWKSILVAIGYPASQRRAPVMVGPNVPVENRLQDIGSRHSINQSGEGAFLKSASLEGYSEGLQNWRKRQDSVGTQAGQFLRESIMQPYISPALRRFDSHLKNPKGLLPSALTGAAATSIPAFLASLATRLYRGEHNAGSMALRDALLGGVAGAAAGGGLHLAEQYGMRKAASFSDAIQLSSAIQRAPTLSPQQKAQLSAWVNSLAPEFLAQIIRAVGPFIGAGTALALWSLFSKQKGLAGGILAATTGGLVGHMVSRPRTPRDPFGNLILSEKGLYGRPYTF